jgi:hypothetical protein
LKGAFLSLGSPIIRVTFKADNEGKSLGILIIELEGTSFNEISLAFTNSMLAGKVPAITVLYSLGISIRVEIEITDLPEIFSIGSGLQCSYDVLLAVRAERFIVEIDFNLVVVG